MSSAGDSTLPAEGRPDRTSSPHNDNRVVWATHQEENNAEKKVGAAIKNFALLVVLGAAYQAMAQDATTPYPKMAPIEQYLMDRIA